MLKNKLIVALDVSGANEARSIVAELGQQVGAFKVGLQLFVSAGPEFVREMTSSGFNVFLDLKFHDIPNTVAKAAVEAARLGVWMFNVHALGGGEMMRRTVDDVTSICEKENLSRPLIIGVTVLTSADQMTLQQVGINDRLENEVQRLARLAEASGLDGVVASPLECRLLRASDIRDDFKIVTPGVRLITATNDDQKRVNTADAALDAGADYIVVGRPILNAPDRAAAVEEILGEMQPVRR